MSAACIRQSCRTPRSGARRGTRTSAGATTQRHRELLDDLVPCIRSSLREHSGALVADGRSQPTIRTLDAFGLPAGHHGHPRARRRPPRVSRQLFDASARSPTPRRMPATTAPSSSPPSSVAAGRSAARRRPRGDATGHVDPGAPGPRGQRDRFGPEDTSSRTSSR